MDELLFNWKEASLGASERVSLEVVYNSTVNEFMEILETWGVPYKTVHNGFRVCIITMNYWDVIRNKTYYSDNGVTEEIEENYYA